MQKSLLTELKSKNLSSCHCCPYGFHIDRDFVQYCESIYNTAKLDKRKQEKRDHRMKHKSVESYLGLDSAVGNKRNIVAESVSDGTKSSEKEALNALDGVVKDFESTWMESLKKNPNNDFIKFAANQSETSAKPISSKGSQKAVVLSRDMLAKIREQISVSLKRTKELEAQVKSIPHLKVKLLVLDKERQRLLNELSSVGKTEASEHHIGNGSLSENSFLSSTKTDVEKHIFKNETFPVISNSTQTSDFSADGRVCLTIEKNETSKVCTTNGSHSENGLESLYRIGDGNIAENINSSEPPLAVISTSTQTSGFPFDSDVGFAEAESCKGLGTEFKKDVGTSCAVLTRDVGVGHIQNKLVSTGVGKKSIFSNSFHFHNENENSELNRSGSSDSVESCSDVDKSPKSELHYSSQSSLEKFRFFPQDLQNKTAKSPEITYLSPEYVSSTSVNNKTQFTELLANEVDSGINKENAEIATDLRMTDLLAYEQWKLDREFSDKTFFKASKEIQTETTSILTSRFHLSQNISSFNLVEASCSKEASLGSGVINNSPNHETSAMYEKIESNFASFQSTSSKDECKTLVAIGVGDIDVNEFVCCQCAEKAHAKALTHSLRMRSVGTNTDEYQSELPSADEIRNYINSLHSTQLPVSDADTFRSSNIDKSMTLQDTPIEHLSEVSDIFHTCIDQNIKGSDIFILSSDSESESATTAVEAFNTYSGSARSEMKNGSDMMKSSSESLDVTGISVDDNNSVMRFNSSSHWSPFESSSNKRVMLSKEVKAACKVLNDCLLKSEGESSKEKTSNSLGIIQKEWFRVANQKNADHSIIEGYLDAFEEFSEKLLCHIVNLADSNGNTAIHYAVSYSNFDVVSILIDSKVCDVNQKNKAGYTCIMLVALAELKCDAHYLVVERLFHMGDINVKASQNGQTALMLAVSHGKVKIVKMLLDAGAEVNLQDNDGSTALMCAAEHGHIDIVRMLLSHPECDSTIADGDGSNALTIAMEAGNKDIGLLIYANMNFSRGNSFQHSVVKQRMRSTPRARTPTLQSFRPSSPSARSTCSLPSAFQLS